MIVEAVAIGLVGALVGIAGGFLVALLLKSLFVSFGIDLPTTGLVLEPRTVIVSLLVGVARHPGLLAGPGPALDPGAADRRPAGGRARRRAARRRALYLVLSALLGLGGLALVLLGLFGGGDAGAAAGVVGGGALAIVFAVSLFSPRLVPPLAAVAGWPLEKLRRLTGRLARENAQRNPSRTAVTAAALMIGLALVAFVTVFAAGLKSSVAQVVDENFAGGIVIQNTDGFSPIPAGGGDRRREGAGGRIGRHDPLGPRQAARRRLDHRRHRADPEHRRSAAGRMEAGRAGDPAQPGRPTRRSSPTRFASSHDLELGDRVPAAHARPVAGRASGSSANSTRSSTCSAASSSPSRSSPATSPRRQDRYDFVLTEPGADAGHGPGAARPKAPKRPSRPPKSSTSRN